MEDMGEDASAAAVVHAAVVHRRPRRTGAGSPLRRPRRHVHFGPPVRLTATLAEATAQAHSAVTTAWHTAADRTRR